MEIQKLNQNIKWQQLTAQEILKHQKEGEKVPTEYQKWAAAISAAMNIRDEVTYEMANGETDLAVLEVTLGKDFIKGGIAPSEETTDYNENKEENPDRAIYENKKPTKVNKDAKKS